MVEPFRITSPKGKKIPVLVSVPHCGTMFPSDLKAEYKSEMIAAPDDTDWFVDKLYDFAPALGMTMISAVYSRWVIDLNRDPESKPLYTDGRIITGLCPTTDFLGNKIYCDERSEVDDQDVRKRLDAYYWPYHKKIESLLNGLHTEFGSVLLWDCHSIRQSVPTIHKEKFPDLILGSADGTSAGNDLIESALSNLGSKRYKLYHNYPFKGGYITRRYGNPANSFHALQLEMSKNNYMDDSETRYDDERAGEMRVLLEATLRRLSEMISK
jgi:N-formylglutamate deformylase